MSLFKLKLVNYPWNFHLNLEVYILKNVEEG